MIVPEVYSCKLYTFSDAYSMDEHFASMAADVLLTENSNAVAETLSISTQVSGKQT